MIKNVFQIDNIDKELLTKTGVSDQGVFIKTVTNPDTGFVTFQTPITRAGIYDYYDENYKDNIRREYRSVEEVFSSDSLESLLSVPVFRLHPEIGKVTSESFKNCSMDLIGATHPDVKYNILKEDNNLLTDGLLRVSYTIFDKSTLDELSSKKLNSCSLGYSCTRVYEPGEVNGHSYDSYQKNIRYNHLAVVPYGRMGININNNLLSLDSIGSNTEKKLFIMNNPVNKTEKKDNETNSSSDELNKTLAKLQAVQDSFDILIDTNKELKKENEELKNKLEEYNSSTKNTNDSVDEQIKERLSSLSSAYGYLTKFGLENLSLDSFFTPETNPDQIIIDTAKKVAPQRTFNDVADAKTYLDCMLDLSKQIGSNDLSNILTNNTISHDEAPKKDKTPKKNKFEQARNQWLNNSK